MDTSIEVIIKTVIGHMSIDEIIELYLKGDVITSALNNSEVLSLLSIKYDLPPIKTFPEFIDEYDEKYVTLRCLNKYSHEECLIRATIAGNLETVTSLTKMKDFPSNIICGVAIAAIENDNMEIVKFLISTDKLNSGQRFTLSNKAARKGDIDLALTIHPRAQPKVKKEWASYLALRGDTQKVLEFVGNNAGMIEGAAEGAAEGGYIELTKLLLSKGASPQNVLRYAVRSGNEELVDYIISLGNPNYFGVLVAAIKSKNKKLIERFSNIDDDFEDIMSAAVETGNVGVIKDHSLLSHEHIIHNAVNYLCIAAEHGHRNVVDLLASHVDEGYELALLLRSDQR